MTAIPPPLPPADGARYWFWQPAGSAVRSRIGDEPPAEARTQPRPALHFNVPREWRLGKRPKLTVTHNLARVVAPIVERMYAEAAALGGAAAVDWAHVQRRFAAACEVRWNGRARPAPANIDVRPESPPPSSPAGGDAEDPEAEEGGWAVAQALGASASESDSDRDPDPDSGPPGKRRRTQTQPPVAQQRLRKERVLCMCGCDKHLVARCQVCHRCLVAHCVCGPHYDELAPVSRPCRCATRQRCALCRGCVPPRRAWRKGEARPPPGAAGGHCRCEGFQRPQANRVLREEAQRRRAAIDASEPAPLALEDISDVFADGWRRVPRRAMLERRIEEGQRAAQHAQARPELELLEWLLLVASEKVALSGARELEARLEVDSLAATAILLEELLTQQLRPMACGGGAGVRAATDDAVRESVANLLNGAHPDALSAAGLVEQLQHEMGPRVAVERLRPHLEQSVACFRRLHPL